MSFSLKDKNLSQKIILLSFLFPLIYWAYLLFSSSMDIKQDAIIYEWTGSVIHDHGWLEFFKTGPNREPIYPLLVSFSMDIAKVFPATYQKIQAVVQIAILFLTQMLSLIVLKKLNVRDFLIAATILYIGFSPAIVNSAFSLYSEIAVYPFLLGTVLLLSTIWKKLDQMNITHAIVWGMITGLFFALATFSKGAFEYLALIALFPFFFIFISALFKKNKRTALPVFLYLFFSVLFFQVVIAPYKFANKHFTGKYCLTSRGAWMLYGSTAKRTSPMDFKRLLAGAASTLGDNVCKTAFDQEDCSFWSFQTSDGLGIKKLGEVMSQYPLEQVDPILIGMAKNNVLQKPFQYFLVTVIEGAKMFFWESTRIGYVNYPLGLAKLFNFTPFKNGIRLLLSLLSIFSFIFSGISAWKDRSILFSLPSSDNEKAITLFFTFWVTLGFILLYSLVSILTRYALPIAPLYLIMIAFSIETLTAKKS